MDNIFKGIVKLSLSQYEELSKNGTITVGDVTIEYDPDNTLYVTTDGDSDVNKAIQEYDNPSTANNIQNIGTFGTDKNNDTDNVELYMYKGVTNVETAVDKRSYTYLEIDKTILDYERGEYPVEDTTFYFPLKLTTSNNEEVTNYNIGFTFLNDSITNISLYDGTEYVVRTIYSNETWNTTKIYGKDFNSLSDNNDYSSISLNIEEGNRLYPTFNIYVLGYKVVSYPKRIALYDDITNSGGSSGGLSLETIWEGNANMETNIQLPKPLLEYSMLFFVTPSGLIYTATPGTAYEGSEPFTGITISGAIDFKTTFSISYADYDNNGYLSIVSRGSLEHNITTPTHVVDNGGTLVKPYLFSIIKILAM